LELTMTAYNENSPAVLGAPLFNGAPVRGWWEHCELFLQLPAANASIGVNTNLDWELTGSGATAVFSPQGGVVLSSQAQPQAVAGVFPHQDIDQTAIAGVQWLTTEDVLFDTTISPTAITGQTIYAGFKLTAAADLTTDANAVLFVFNNALGPNWQIATSIGGTDVLVDTGIPAVAAAPVRLTLRGGFTDDNGDAIVKAYINGQIVASVVGPTAGNLLPTVLIVGIAQSTVIRAIRVGRAYPA
jgi:hypothetical protein